MIHYRKHKSGRTFCKLDGNDYSVTRVVLMFESAIIARSISKMMYYDIGKDDDMYRPSTEEEFNIALAQAQEFINVKL